MNTIFGLQIRIPAETPGFPNGNGIAVLWLAWWMSIYQLCKSITPAPAINDDFNNLLWFIESENPEDMRERIADAFDHLGILPFVTLVQLAADGKTWDTIWSPDGPANIATANPGLAAEMDRLLEIHRLLERHRDITKPGGQRE